MFEVRIDPTDVQYMGMPGVSEQCLLAVDVIVNSEVPPRKASLVTWVKDKRNMQEEHLFLFWDWNKVHLTVVHSGFASGYSGQGPRSFSQALCMIWDRTIPINMVIASEALFKAIEGRRLTERIIDELRSADDRPLTWPWLEWIYPEHVKQVEEETFWREFHQPKLNVDSLDPELNARCRKTFAHDREAAVAAAYKVVEERLRKLLDKPRGYGGQLVKDALDPGRGALVDKKLSLREQEGMCQLFLGAMKFVRNPRSHRFLDEEDGQLDIELIYLADLLLRLLPETEPA